MISSSFQLAYSASFLPHGLPIKGNQIWPEKVPKIFAEILYNSNSNSYTSNNSNSKVDTIRITHNNMCIGNSNRLNRIVRTSSNPSINAKCV